jgi:Tol biopolymer transport system component
MRRRGSRHAARVFGGFAVLSLLAGAFVAVVSAPAHAAFPGISGLVAFQSDRDGHNEIYVMNAGGANQIRLTNNVEGNSQPAWSPDGTMIAFSSSAGGTSDIWVMDANFANAVDITNHPADDLAPSWSPDGTKIAFETARDQFHPSDHEIFVMGTDGSAPTDLTNDPSSDQAPDWSPDGTRILFFSSRTFNGVFVMNANGTSQTALPASLAGD